VLEVNIGRGDEGMDAGRLGAAHRLRRPLDVPLVAARQAGDGRALDPGGDGADRLEVAGRGGREPRLHHVHPKRDQGVGDLQLLVGRQRGAGRLLAVAQRGVEDDDPGRAAYVSLAHG
jgi:hypothetical protein